MSAHIWIWRRKPVRWPNHSRKPQFYDLSNSYPVHRKSLTTPSAIPAATCLSPSYAMAVTAHSPAITCAARMRNESKLFNHVFRNPDEIPRPAMPLVVTTRAPYYHVPSCKSGCYSPDLRTIAWSSSRIDKRLVPRGGQTCLRCASVDENPRAWRSSPVHVHVAR